MYLVNIQLFDWEIELCTSLTLYLCTYVLGQYSCHLWCFGVCLCTYVPLYSVNEVDLRTFWYFSLYLCTSLLLAGCIDGHILDISSLYLCTFVFGE